MSRLNNEICCNCRHWSNSGFCQYWEKITDSKGSCDEFEED